MKKVLQKIVDSGIRLSSQSKVIIPLLDEIQQRTLFLSYRREISIPEKIYCILNDVTSLTLCSCGKRLKFSSKNFCYYKFCSLQCSGKSKERIDKIIQTKIQNDYFISVDKNKRTKEQSILNDPTVEILSKRRLKDDCVLLLNNGIDISNVKSILRTKYPSLFKSILFYYKISFQEVFYLFSIGRYDTPKCLMCGNKAKFYTFNRGYSPFCGESCRNKELYQRKRYTILSYIITIAKENKQDVIDYEKVIKEKKLLLLCENNHITERAISNFYKSPKCPVCFSPSKQEDEMGKFLQENNVRFMVNNRKTIAPFELDFYLPDFNVAIEMNGLYYHSEGMLQTRNLTGNVNVKHYHLMKTNLCKAKGIQLIHVFEDEWMYRQDIVKSVILSKINQFKEKYHARKCYVKEIDDHVKSVFLKENHLQGDDNSSVRLGLFYKDRLTAVMTFGRRKITGSDSEFELLRFCNKIHTKTMGGASKLFSHFIKNFDYDKIKSYSDIRYSDGKLYEKLGFSFKHQSKPNYWYFKTNSYELFHRSGFQKHLLQKKIKKFWS